MSSSKPVMAFFIKYEFWYNYLHILQYRGIPAYSVEYLSVLTRYSLSGMDVDMSFEVFYLFFCSDEESKKLLESQEYMIRWLLARNVFRPCIAD